MIDRFIRALRRLSAAGSDFIGLVLRRDAIYEKPAPQPLFGENQHVETFAFSGGGFDALMELGVVHALIIREHLHPDKSRLPHAFSGVSTGAVMAAVAAEVLGQEFNNKDPKARTDARVSRLRQMLEQFLEAPLGLIGSLLPDLYEVESGRPLKALDLPIHNALERRDRNEALEARAGFITLINGILGTSVPLAAATRLVRLHLSARAAREELSRWRHEIGWTTVRPRRLLRAGYEVWRLIVDSVALAIRYGGTLCEVLFRLYFAHLTGGFRLLRDGVLRELSQQTTIGEHLHRFVLWLAPAATDAGAVLSIVRSGLIRTWWVFIRVFSITLWYGTLAGGVVGLGWHAIATLLLRSAVGRDVLARAEGFGAYPHLIFVTAVGVIAVLVLLWLPLWFFRITFTRSVLRAVNLDRDLLADYDVRRFLINLFDPNYYGQSEAHPSLVARALRDEGACADASRGRKKTLWDLSKADRLHVAPAVVDITKGELEILQDTWRVRGAAAPGSLEGTPVPVVDALLASVSLVPFLRAQRIENANRDSYYIDASNIASEPLNGLMDYLRDRIASSAKSITVYAVTPFPVTSPTPMNKPGTALLGAARVVDRVRDLRRYQIAKIDRQLTKVYTDALRGPGRRAVTEIETGSGRTRRYLSANVVAIETPKPLRVYRRMLRAESDDKRQKVVLKATAAGCKASLQVFEQEAIQQAALEGRRLQCPALFAKQHLVCDDTTGMPEICGVCDKEFALPIAPQQPATPIPVEDELQRAEPDVSVVGSPPPSKPAPDQPWSVLVLSGGVFRGVFQVGVVAGCVEACVEPKLLVGSSVGSLMMTAAAKIWSKGGATPEKSRDLRRSDLRTLAATFLALDQFIITDRFADLVRRITLRAGYTNVSVKDVDRTIRTYAEVGAPRFSNTTRRVLAAFERLAYITPFELLELVRAGREERWYDVRQQLLASAQNFLDRSGVRDEILGADPLLLLIEALGLPDGRAGALRPEFDCYQAQGMYRLVTATNLQAGSLEVFGMKASNRLKTDASFSETLLASGAFPLVFRPRLQSDVQPWNSDYAQYTDGGVMDNLPLYSVAQFLTNASGPAHKLTVRRPPQAPHLVITGSLEPEFKRRSLEPREAEYWPSVRRRVARIAYNNRALGFAETQENLDAIYKYQTATVKNPDPFVPVRMRLSVIRAQWLCDTFGFHPMLGFKRVKQARSIAHGCASTLAYLGAEVEEHPDWGATWGLGLDPNTIEKDTVYWVEKSRKEYFRLLQSQKKLIDPEWQKEYERPIPPPTLRAAPELRPSHGRSRPRGMCWFRQDAVCPFSREAAPVEDGDQTKWLDLIYRSCGRDDTHESRQS